MSHRAPVLMNERTGQPIATDVSVAATRRERRRGLLGRRSLDNGAALILSPCTAIHTAGMHFAIDVIFLDPAGRVLRTVPALRPWRVAACRGAGAVVECAAGSLRAVDLVDGDRLYLAPAGQM